MLKINSFESSARLYLEPFKKDHLFPPKLILFTYIGNIRELNYDNDISSLIYGCLGQVSFLSEPIT